MERRLNRPSMKVDHSGTGSQQTYIAWLLIPAVGEQRGRCG